MTKKGIAVINPEQKRTHSVATLVEINDATEENLVAKAETSHVTKKIIPIIQWKANKPPIKTATPFPPWKFRKTGNVWPIIVAKTI